MLYHPCAPEKLVDQLRKIVVGCLRSESQYSELRNMLTFQISTIQMIFTLQKTPDRAKHKVYHKGKASYTGRMALQVDDDNDH